MLLQNKLIFHFEVKDASARGHVKIKHVNVKKSGDPCDSKCHPGRICENVLVQDN